MLQNVVEDILEDVNNILNSGEVPNLFELDEYEQVIIGCRSAAKQVDIAVRANMMPFTTSTLIVSGMFILIL
jgi:hypothetical protein